MVYGQLCERALYGRTHNPEFRLEKISPDREKDFVSKGIDLRKIVEGYLTLQKKGKFDSINRLLKL